MFEVAAETLSQLLRPTFSRRSKRYNAACRSGLKQRAIVGEEVVLAVVYVDRLHRARGCLQGRPNVDILAFEDEHGPNHQPMMPVANVRYAQLSASGTYRMVFDSAFVDRRID